MIEDPDIEESKESVVRKWRNDFRNKRHHNIGIKEHLDTLYKKANDYEDEWHQYYELLWKDAINTCKVVYNVKPPDMNNEEAMDDFITEYLELVRHEFDAKEEVKEKTKRKKGIGKLAKSVSSQMQVQKDMEKLRQSPLARTQKRVYEEALQDVGSRAKKRLFNIPEETESSTEGMPE